MVSPMREKRVWPPARKEADAAETVAQFEATVAVARQTVAKSGEVLSSAKEDLSDHQRWLQLQTAAVEKDRVRHERWLQRQRDQKEAAERREEAKLRRRAFFQRIWAAIKGAVMAVVHAITGAIGFVVRKIVGAVAFVLRAIGRGFAFVGNSIKNSTLYLFRQIRFAALWLAVKLQELFGAAGAKFIAGLTFLGGALGRFGRSAARATSGAVTGVSTRAGAFARSTGEAVSAGVSQVSAKTQDLARSTGDAVSSGVAQVSAKAQEFAAQRTAREAEQSAAAGSEQAVAAAEDGDAPEVEAIEAFAEDASVVDVGAAGLPEVPAHFRTAAERAENPTVYQFTSTRPESFFLREEVASEPSEIAPSEPADIEEDDAPAFANPYAEFAAHADTASVQDGVREREIVFGAETTSDSGAAGPSELADRARAITDSAHARLAAAFAGIAVVVAAFGRKVAAWTAASFAVASAKIGGMAPTAGERITQSVSGAGAKARDLGNAAASSIKPALSGVSNRVQSAMPAFHAWLAGAGDRAKHYAGPGAAVAAAQVKSLRDAGRNALSLPEGVDRGEISRMLIVAGILMLICGALLIGSGLILRAGAPMPTFSSPFSSEPEPSEAADEVDVVWLFDDAERTAEERSVFVGADGPGPARLIGLAFNAENWSDHTLTDFHGTVKPDLKIIDFKLAIDLVESVGPMPASPAPDTVPPRTAFRLIVPFPREVMDGAEGVEVDDFLGGYGGLTLKVRYAVDGREKSFIQYLSPAMLKAQLADVAGNADSLARF
jgi:hypothetical protein